MVQLRCIQKEENCNCRLKEGKIIKKQLVIIGIVAILVTVGLSGCDILKSDRDKFVGTWRSDSERNDFTLFSNGTFVMPDQYYGQRTGTWSLKDGQFVMIYDPIQQGQSFTLDYDYTFSNNDKTITLTDVDGTPYSYTKS
jgi:hypothetical protein